MCLFEGDVQTSILTGNEYVIRSTVYSRGHDFLGTICFQKMVQNETIQSPVFTITMK